MVLYSGAADSRGFSFELVLSLLEIGAHIDEVYKEKITVSKMAPVKLSTIVDPMSYFTLRE